ncbi:hypothetical protein HH310_06315 [Actinoplanes sp. TBRC 11911]|uniref:hypothetical protein n=1 Tax=Actinoplanes sp. TBRC 11911 TaxID=2729386 RepID=UPI00145C4071|nr:hypothetical protein [Actinoplanes sp. TBRC 11911]NMO50805.1 hypothetical protein [Actinoplanes sp. TBRC 11911]
MKLLPVAAGILILALSACSAAEGASATPSTSPDLLEYSAPPQTAYEKAADLLDDQAQAMLDGNEQKWLAAIDPGKPALVAQYRAMFESLHTLGVANFGYRQKNLRSKPSSPKIEMATTIEYCMSACGLGSVDPPTPSVHQYVTVETVAGQQRITAMRVEQSKDNLDPVPWEEKDLVVRSGKRVIVAGPHSEASNLDKVLAAAEQAATLNDRFAAIEENPQTRYRVYVADAKAWKRWFGKAGTNGAVGYAYNIGGPDTEVVLRMDELRRSKQDLISVVKHEMGHVVTLSDLNTQNDDDMWLSEGVAEYIGEYPKAATQSLRMAVVRASGKRLTTIAQPALADDASIVAANVYYGFSHLAVDCMAKTYGEKKLFDFVKVKMREGFSYDDASRKVYGKPFKTVDKTCVARIRNQV